MSCVYVCCVMYLFVFFYVFFTVIYYLCFFFFFSSRRRHTRFDCDWSSDVCSSDLRRLGFRVEELPLEIPVVDVKKRLPRPIRKARGHPHLAPEEVHVTVDRQREQDRKSVV